MKDEPGDGFKLFMIVCIVLLIFAMGLAASGILTPWGIDRVA